MTRRPLLTFAVLSPLVACWRDDKTIDTGTDGDSYSWEDPNAEIDALREEAITACADLLSTTFNGSAWVTAVDGSTSGIHDPTGDEGTVTYFTHGTLSRDRYEDQQGNTGWPIRVGGLMMEFGFGAFYPGDHMALLEYVPGDSIPCTLVLETVHTWQLLPGDQGAEFWMRPSTDIPSATLPHGTFRVETGGMSIEGDWGAESAI